MKLKSETISELGNILKSEFNYEMQYEDLEKLAYSLVGYFDLLLKIENRHEFRNGSGEVIDSKSQDVLDKRKEKD